MSPRRLSLPLFLLAAWLGACDSTTDPGPFLGPVTASTYKPPAPVTPGGVSCLAPGAAPADVDPLVVNACAGVIAAGPDRPGVVGTAAGYALALAGEVTSYPDQDGCPVLTKGATLVAGDASALAQGDALWVARPDVIEVIAPEGEGASCAVSGARSLAASGAQGWAVTGRGVVGMGVSAGECVVSDPWSLSGVPLAIAHAEEGALWVAVVPSGCGSAPLVRKYLEDGSEAEGAPVFDAARQGLCTVTALVERGGNLLVVDGACGQVVLVDGAGGALLARWESPDGQAPVSAAASPAGALLVTSSPSGQGSSLRFFHAPL